MEEKRLQMSESFFLTAILAIVGGFLDAYSYLMRGHVFANAQTGNIVLFGVYLEKRNFTQAIYYLVDRKSTRLNSSHTQKSRMPSSA